jgi:hypothetical protein
MAHWHIRVTVLATWALIQDHIDCVIAPMEWVLNYPGVDACSGHYPR